MNDARTVQSTIAFPFRVIVYSRSISTPRNHNFATLEAALDFRKDKLKNFDTAKVEVVSVISCVSLLIERKPSG